MKIKEINVVHSQQSVPVTTCFVSKGYLQSGVGQLPDVDIDYQSNRRSEIKEYIQKRYNRDGKQCVFSAGTLSTLKVKAILKDVARIKHISPQLVNSLTSIFKDDQCDYTDIFKLAAENERLAEFIREYPDLFEDIRTLMFQPRSASIHASAFLITPDKKEGKSVECFDFIPIKKVDGVLVSENDGYELEELGLLKNDCLATKELSKLQSIMDICNREYGLNLSLAAIATGELNDQKTYELLAQGHTQNVFQFSSRGMTKFLMDIHPTCINDLIAASALFRPATLTNGATELYINYKNGSVEPTYLWGTYNALKDTYGLITYQEQVVLIAREVGGFSLSDGVKLVKFISKKRVHEIQTMKNKFMEGAEKNGCPIKDAIIIWSQIEACGSYLFNKSHATAYAVTSYVGAYLKANYPTVFYTVGLQWGDDEELITLIGEMRAYSNVKLIPPDINNSKSVFYTDYTTNEIIWSLSRIKQLGVKTVEYIVRERAENGNFTGITDFINRIFKYEHKKSRYWIDKENKRTLVNTNHIYNLILAGCFDKVEHIKSVVERYTILKRAAKGLGIELKEKDIPSAFIESYSFWTQQQIRVSGIGTVDYKYIYDNSEAKIGIKEEAPYTTLQSMLLLEEGKKVVLCATILGIQEKKFKNKKTGDIEVFCKMLLQQNNDISECIIWPEEYAKHRVKLVDAKNRLIIFSAIVKYNRYTGKNELQFIKKSFVKLL